MKILDIEQGSPEWISLRKTKITSTGMSSVLNLNPFRSAMDYWKEMVGLKPPTTINAAMRRGMDNEDDARILANIVLETQLEPLVIVSDESPWLMSSLDGLTGDLKTLWEVKTPLAKNFKRMCENPIPVYYNIQMQTSFAASDGIIKGGHFSVYSPEKGVLHNRPVEPDESLIEEIIRESEIFWHRIRDFEAPPPLHEIIETDDMRVAVDQLIVAKDMLDRAQRLKEEAYNRLKVIAMGRNIQGFGAKVTSFFTKGTVDYKRIPQLEGVDLDEYRKPAKECTRITTNG